MRQLSIIKQIIIINMLVMTIFVTIFSVNNYIVVSEQLSKMADEKVNSVLHTILPTVSVNLSLGLEKNYKNIIDNTFRVYGEFLSIVLVNSRDEILYRVTREEPEPNSKYLEVYIEDTIMGVPDGGKLKVEYGFPNVYEELLKEYLLFYLVMFILFILSLVALMLLLRTNLYPLRRLITDIDSYKLQEKNTFSKSDSKDEVSIINNTIVEMLEKIEKEVDLKIYYEQEMMKRERLACMGDMIDNIAHQWRQPLMKINAVLLNMDCRVQDDDIDREYFVQKMDEISETVEHMSQTIDVFREYTNPNKLKSRYEVVTMIEHALLVLKSSLDGIEVNLKFTDAYEMIGVKNEFVQVIVSILSNAIEALNSREVQQPAIWIEVISVENRLTISIEDSGGGIDEEIIGKIFNPYFTTKYKTGGTGLGLYMCKMIVMNSLDGEIGVTNSKNGAKFTLVFNRED